MSELHAYAYGGSADHYSFINLSYNFSLLGDFGRIVPALNYNTRMVACNQNYNGSSSLYVLSMVLIYLVTASTKLILRTY